MAKAAPPPPPPPQAPIDINLRDALEERYLAYALSTIMGRALPDARDGLKPVHRRILYGMHILKLDPGTAFKKCAKIVGDVMGSFHPHGDQAIYDALVRLAQDFSSRYPLVEGQGNFGNIDGDNAAAYRYTEARMTDVARLLLDGIDEDSIDWRDNYSGDARAGRPARRDPEPARQWRAGHRGRHGDLDPAAQRRRTLRRRALSDRPSQGRCEQLLAFAPGPDFPTGGIIIDDRASIAETYRTGRGAFRLRARWAREDTGRGGWVAVVTEIPFGVQKSRLIEQLANLLNERKALLLGDVRDESTEDVRIVLEPKTRTVEPATLMESLFKLSELETRVADEHECAGRRRHAARGQPRRGAAAMARPSARVLLRRSRHRLAAIERRLEMLAGMIVVFLNLDEVIRIIREEDEPKDALKLRFSLSEAQVNYVLDTRLRALRRLEEMALRKEQADLAARKANRPAARRRKEAVADDRRPDPRRQEEIRSGDAARAPAHDFEAAPDVSSPISPRR